MYNWGKKEIQKIWIYILLESDLRFSYEDIFLFLRGRYQGI